MEYVPQAERGDLRRRGSAGHGGGTRSDMHDVRRRAVVPGIDYAGTAPQHHVRLPTLCIAQGDPADELSRDPLALVLGMLLDQQMRQRSSVIRRPYRTMRPAESPTACGVPITAGERKRPDPGPGAR